MSLKVCPQYIIREKESVTVYLYYKKRIMSGISNIFCVSFFFSFIDNGKTPPLALLLYIRMVLTRYQQANLNPSKKTEAETQKRRISTTAADSNEADLVKDPPLLTISRSRDSFEDDTKDDTTVKVDSLLEQLDE